MANEKLILKVANDVVKPIRNTIDSFILSIASDNPKCLTTAAAPARIIKEPANCEMAVDMV